MSAGTTHVLQLGPLSGFKRTIRAACERCRNQKLRCIKDPSSPTCARCASFGAACIFQEALPAGRPPSTAKKENFLGQTSWDERKQQDGVDGLKDASHPRNTDDSFSQMPSFCPTPHRSPSPDQTNLPSPKHQLHHATFPERARSGSTQYKDDSNPNFDVYENSSFDFGQFSTSTSDMPLNVAHLNSNDPYNLGKLQQGFEPISRGSMGFDGTFNDPTDMLSSVLSPSIENSGNRATSRGSSIDAADEHRFRCRLVRESESQISQSLAELSLRIKSELAKANNRGLTQSLDTEFARRVIQNTGTFVSILRVCRKHMRRHLIERLSSLVTSAHETELDLDSTKHLISAEEDSLGAFELLILYHRLVDLHTVLYRQMMSFVCNAQLHRTGGHEIQGLEPLLQDLNMGGFALGGFGDFQLKMLLQGSSSLLSEVETELGLPEHHRVGLAKSSPPRRPSGILGHLLPQDMIEVMMRTIRLGSKQGALYRDGIDGLTENRALTSELQELLTDLA